LERQAPNRPVKYPEAAAGLLSDQVRGGNDACITAAANDRLPAICLARLRV
jgi:hypothetical protein